MRVRAKHGAFVVVLLSSVLVSGWLWAANRANPIEVDGDKLSVHSEGMPLGELLAAVESMTGVQFRFDELLAEEKIFVDFRGLSLSEGIKKIIYPLNCATIYDDTGKLLRVLILGRWKGSGMMPAREGGNISPGGSQFRRPDTISSIPKGGSDISGGSKIPPLVKGRRRYENPSLGRPDPLDGPPESQDEEMEGPPTDKPYVVDGPPIKQNQTSEGPPDLGGSPNPPPTDPERAPMDGPPLDREYLTDGPPGWEGMVMGGPS